MKLRSASLLLIGAVCLLAQNTVLRAPFDMTSFTAYYTMQEGSGGTLVDHSGHGNNGAQVGTVTWTTDGGTSFANSQSNYWALPTAITAGSNLRSFLIALAYGPSGSGLCNFQTPLGPISGTGTAVMISYDSNGDNCDLTPLLYNAGGANTLTRYAEAVGYGIHVIGFTMDTSVAANNKVYIDGVLCSNPFAQFVSVPTTAQLALGAWPAGTSGGGFAGTIYGAAFGTSTLTDGQQYVSAQTMLTNLRARGVNLNPLNVDTTSYLIGVGDSLMLGYLGSGPTILSAMTTAETFTKLNMGASGHTLAQLGAKLPGIISRLSRGQFNVVILWGGTNDLCSALVTPTVAEQRYMAAGLLLRQARIPTVVATMIDRTGSACETAKNAFNPWVRAHWSEFGDALADVASDPNLGPDGVNTNGTYFNGDGIHLTAAGYTLASSYFGAAVNRITEIPAPSKQIPPNLQSANYTTTLADAGGSIMHPSADVTARTFTIDSNSNVPYQVGAAITFVNAPSAGTITIAINTDTLVLAGVGTTGSRTLAAGGFATATKISATTWLISGPGLT
jgi:lysophospholipase L1-like esterase